MATQGANTTTLAKSIFTEQINPDVIKAPGIVRSYEALTWMADASEGHSETYKFLNLTGAAISGTQTETEAIGATDFGLDDATVTAGVVGARHFVSKQGLQDSILGQEVIFNSLADRVRNRINKDFCALASSCATETDKTGAELNLDNFDEAYAAFLALWPNLSRHVLLCSNAQLAHIRKGIRNSGNGGLIMGAGLDVFNGRKLSSYQGDWSGVEIWVGEMPDDGVSDVAGMFLACDPPGEGAQSGAGLAVWWAPTPSIQPEPVQVGFEFVVDARYGVGLTADHLSHRIVSKKAT